MRGSISQREDLFRQRVAALYRWQRSGDPFWFVDGPSDLSATLQRKRYLEATLAFDRGLIADLQSQSERQEVLRLRLSEQKDRLTAQKKVLVLARAAVAEEASNKKRLLASLRQEKDNRLKALREMEAAAQRLQKMLEDIARRALVRPKRSAYATLDGPRSRCHARPDGLAGKGTGERALWQIQASRSLPPSWCVKASTSMRPLAKRFARWKRAGWYSPTGLPATAAW